MTTPRATLTVGSGRLAPARSHHGRHRMHAQVPHTHHPRWSRLSALALALTASLVLLLAPATASAAGPVTPATDGGSTAGCTGGAWPLSVQGMPAFHAGSLAGDQIWHSATGWH